MRIGIRDNRRRSDRVRLSMASLIDVVFLLLAFFLITSVVSEPEDSLSPNLQLDQDASTGAKQDFIPQIVEVVVVNEGTIFRIGGQDFVDRSALTDALRELPKDPGLFVRVHAGPTVADAAFAIQCGRDAGFSEVTYVPVDE